MQVAGSTVSTFRAFDGNLSGGGTMLSQVDLDPLIAHLRQELDRIDHAILVLKRMAMAKRAGASGRVRRSFRVHVNKAGTKHRVLKG
jgi:hypothetical protein